MSTVFNRAAFDAALTAIARHYEKSAPTVEAWADMLSSATGDDVRLSDVTLAERLLAERPDGSTASNLVYHLCHRLGRDTAGHSGY